MNLAGSQVVKWSIQMADALIAALPKVIVYIFLEKYRKLMDKTGFSKSQGFPKIGLSDIFSSQTPQEMVGHASTMKDSTTRDTYVRSEIESEEQLWTSMMKEKAFSASYGISKETRGLYDLRALLVGKIYSIVNDVINYIPLQGYCDHCPDRKITIKDK